VSIILNDNGIEKYLYLKNEYTKLIYFVRPISML
jgi:hypothetical protein